MLSAQSNTLSKRLVTIGIEVYGQLKKYSGLHIVAVGSKYANPNQDTCECKITNLDRATQNYITNETSPFNQNRTPKRLYVYAGYETIGESLIFVGDIVKALPSQPPDITLTIVASTKNFEKGNIVAKSQPGTASLMQIASEIARDLGSSLNFQATNKSISNYNYSGSALKQVNMLEDSGQVEAYIDNNTLVVKDARVPLTGRVKNLNVNTGMVEVPEMTELGVRAKYFIDNESVLGGALNITSIQNPSINGLYVIYKLNFEIANREKPFYWVAEAVRP